MGPAGSSAPSRLVLLVLVAFGCTSGGEESDRYRDTDSGGRGDTSDDSAPDSDPTADDADGDGFSSSEDCDDSDPAVNPGAVDACGDGVDEDCDGHDAACRWSGAYVARDVSFTLGGAGTGDAAGGLLACDDLDHDGISEILVGAPYADRRAGRAYLLTGVVSADASLEAVAAARYVASDGEGEFGTALDIVGEMDGDGVSDLIFGQPADRSGAVWIHSGVVRGEVTGASALASWAGETSGDALGTSVTGLDDFTGDGLPDVAVGAPGSDLGAPRAGAAYVLAGPLAATTGSALDDAAVRVLGREDVGLGLGAADAGDVDGDGVTDLVLAGDLGVYLFVGGRGVDLFEDDADMSADLAQYDTGVGRYETMSSAGDVDGDGLPDLFLGQHLGGTAWVLSGAQRGPVELDEVAITRFDEVPVVGTVRSAGDVDADGEVDLVVGAMRASDGSVEVGAALFYYGPVVGVRLPEGADAAFLGTESLENMGVAVCAPGDVTGDGHVDLAVGSAYGDGDEDSSGALHILPGP